MTSQTSEPSSAMEYLYGLPTPVAEELAHVAQLLVNMNRLERAQAAVIFATTARNLAVFGCVEGLPAGYVLTALARIAGPTESSATREG